MQTQESLKEERAEGAPRVKADSIATSLAWVLALAVVQRGLGFVREVLFCRWLDQEDLGQWAMAFVFLMTAAAVVTFGIQGSLSRYAEFYRQRGQLRAYLRRVAVTSALCALGAGAIVYWQRSWFSSLIFGHADRTELVAALAAVLPVVVANNFFIDFFTALRLFRAVSAIQFFNGVLFVALGLAAVRGWRIDAMAVLAGFGGAFGLVALAAAGRAVAVMRALPPDETRLAHRSFWPHVLRAGAALWAYNFLINLFEIVDRTMLVHFSPLDAHAALAAVGDYHSARVVPSLLATAAALVASTLMPHWSHAWETGRRAEIAKRQRFVLKAMALGLFAAAIAVQAAAPLLFDFAFAGKFNGGRAVLPCVLATAVWTGTAAVAFNYLWCTERLTQCGMALAASVAVNAALGAWWIPAHGLWGAALATAAAHFLQLALLYRLSQAHGLKLDIGLWLLSAAPALLGFGLPTAAGTLAALVGLSFVGTRIFSASEKAHVAELYGRLAARWGWQHGRWRDADLA